MNHHETSMQSAWVTGTDTARKRLAETALFNTVMNPLRMYFLCTFKNSKGSLGPVVPPGPVALPKQWDGSYSKCQHSQEIRRWNWKYVCRKMKTRTGNFQRPPTRQTHTLSKLLSIFRNAMMSKDNRFLTWEQVKTETHVNDRVNTGLFMRWFGMQLLWFMALPSILNQMNWDAQDSSCPTVLRFLSYCAFTKLLGKLAHRNMQQIIWVGSGWPCLSTRTNYSLKGWDESRIIYTRVDQHNWNIACTG